MTFTFFLSNGEIYESRGANVDEAFRGLCQRLFRSWASLAAEVVDTFTEQPK